MSIINSKILTFIENSAFAKNALLFERNICFTKEDFYAVYVRKIIYTADVEKIKGKLYALHLKFECLKLRFGCFLVIFVTVKNTNSSWKYIILLKGSTKFYVAWRMRT